jgi:hypothetical protein
MGSSQRVSLGVGVALGLVGIGVTVLGWESRALGIALLALSLVVLVAALGLPRIRRWVRRRPPPLEPPTPPRLPNPLFAITVPLEPHNGGMSGHRLVMFDNVYVDSVERRTLRFGLTMPGRQFLDHVSFYWSNPAEVNLNRQSHLVFIQAPSSLAGLGDRWQLSIHTGQGRNERRFVINGLGTFACLDDGSVERTEPS